MRALRASNPDAYAEQVQVWLATFVEAPKGFESEYAALRADRPDLFEWRASSGSDGAAKQQASDLLEACDWPFGRDEHGNIVTAKGLPLGPREYDLVVAAPALVASLLAELESRR
jgi:hypothetical protein